MSGIVAPHEAGKGLLADRTGEHPFVEGGGPDRVELVLGMGGERRAGGEGGHNRQGIQDFHSRARKMDFRALVAAGAEAVQRPGRVPSARTR
jgi:hypothetical protein